ncbi:MAG TPA: DUF6112 family protein [Acidimicrobiales bacterium]|nr:DUF6112 family protein [Acidimicrobiales bacterium]
MLHAAHVLAGVIRVSPNDSLPGTSQIQSVVGGVITWILYICAFAVAVGAGAWGFGQRMGNFTSAHRGRELVVGGLLGGVLVGAAQMLVNFAFATGQAAH